jgi:hypothetical protein
MAITRSEYEAGLALVKAGRVWEFGGRTAVTQEQAEFILEAEGGFEDGDEAVPFTVESLSGMTHDELGFFCEARGITPVPKKKADRVEALLAWSGQEEEGAE